MAYTLPSVYILPNNLASVGVTYNALPVNVLVPPVFTILPPVIIISDVV